MAQCIQCKDRDDAMTLASKMYNEIGCEVAVYSDEDGTFWILDQAGAWRASGVGPDSPPVLEFDPAKGTPVKTTDYAGPDRRHTPRRFLPPGTEIELILDDNADPTLEEVLEDAEFTGRI